MNSTNTILIIVVCFFKSVSLLTFSKLNLLLFSLCICLIGSFLEEWGWGSGLRGQVCFNFADFADKGQQ